MNNNIRLLLTYTQFLPAAFLILQNHQVSLNNLSNKMNLSQNQLEIYLEQILGFSNWKESKVQQNVLDFITDLMQRFQYHNYFHNVNMITTPSALRKPPTLEDCISTGLNGKGGVCVHQNTFFSHLLNALGFNSYTAAGSYVASQQAEGTHCICILKLSEKNLYAIDVGCGNPVDEPIPLDNLPYTKMSGGFRYEYKYNVENGWYERWQLDGSILGASFEDPTSSQLRYRFTLSPKLMPYYENILLNIFTNSETSVFLRNAFLFRRINLPGDTESRFVVIFGKSFAIYNESTRILKKLDLYIDLLPTIFEYFPKLNPSTVKEYLIHLDNIVRD